MTAREAIELQKAFIFVLKKRFNNLGAEELSELAGNLVLAAASVMDPEKEPT